MDTIVRKLKLIFQDTDLRWRIIFTAGILVLFRLGTHIPVPGVDTSRLQQFFSNNQFFGLLNLFSGGGLSNLSIMMLGVGPFITGSIIIQLLTVIFPALKEMYHEDGEAGRRKIAQYSRLLTIPLAILQGFSFLILLERQGVLPNLGLFQQVISVAVVTAGSVLLMWLGELISEYGVGNGVSLIIFAGILARLPSTISQLALTFDYSQIPLYLAFAAASVVIIAAVVYVTEAERPIPVTYAKRVRGMKVYGGSSTYLPLRLNQAGVMPIIFALSILLFPQMIANFFAHASNNILATISNFILGILNNTWIYAVLYFLLVFVFTYFYAAVTFDPEAIATNLQKSGAFIPGIRPGQPTSDYLAKIITRLTLVGAIFLGVVAMLPIVMRAITGIAALAVGGTALLIVISVCLEFVKQIDGQLAMREY